MLEETKLASPYNVAQNYIDMGTLFIKLISDIPFHTSFSDLPYSNQVTSITIESSTAYRGPAYQDMFSLVAHTALTTEIKMRDKIKSYAYHYSKVCHFIAKFDDIQSHKLRIVTRQINTFWYLWYLDTCEKNYIYINSGS